MAFFDKKEQEEAKPPLPTVGTAPAIPEVSTPAATPEVSPPAQAPKTEKGKIPQEWKNKFSADEIRLYEDKRKDKDLAVKDLEIRLAARRKLRSLQDQKIIKALKLREAKEGALTREQRTHALCLIAGELFADGNAAGTELLKKMAGKEWKKKGADALTLFAKEKKLDLAFRVKKDA